MIHLPRVQRCTAESSAWHHHCRRRASEQTDRADERSPNTQAPNKRPNFPASNTFPVAHPSRRPPGCTTAAITSNIVSVDGNDVGVHHSTSADGHCGKVRRERYTHLQRTADLVNVHIGKSWCVWCRPGRSKQCVYVGANSCSSSFDQCVVNHIRVHAAIKPHVQRSRNVNRHTHRAQCVRVGVVQRAVVTTVGKQRRPASVLRSFCCRSRLQQKNICVRDGERILFRVAVCRADKRSQRDHLADSLETQREHL